MVNDTLGIYFKALRLPAMTAVFEDALKKAEHEGWSFQKLLKYLCECELQERDSRRVTLYLKQSGIPEGKSITNLKEAWLPVKIRRILPSLLEGAFIDRKENILCFGLPGRGKSFFISALCRELIMRQSRKILFINASKLIERLVRAKSELRLEAEFKKLDKFEVIALDEVGYCEHRREEMEVFFLFLSNCYERISLCITSNLVFSEWGERIFKDPMLGMAAVDRLIHHGIILEFTNEGIREKQAKERLGKDMP